MCGGWATRFLPVSKSVPKELLPFYDTPILGVLVEDLIESGVKEILFVIREGKECIAKYFSRDIAFESQTTTPSHAEKLNTYSKAQFYFTYQNFQKGTGHALLQAHEWVGDSPFFLLNGDEIIKAEPNIFTQLATAYQNTKNAIIAVSKVSDSDIEKYGIIDFCDEKNGYIKEIVEKPKFCDAPSKYANIGTYVFEADIFEYIENKEEMPITNTINKYLKNHKISAIKISGKRYDLGNPLGYVISNFDNLLRNNNTRKQAIDYLQSVGFYKDN